jgi:hypothetical protein
MKKDTINKLINHLQTIKDLGTSIPQYEASRSLYKGFFAERIGKVKADEHITDEDRNKILDLYESVKYKFRRNSEDIKANDVEKNNDRVEIKLDRDEEDHIIRYNFTIFIRDKEPLIGSFSRDEMSLVYRLYSSLGSNITQREVSRFFPEFSLYDFKRILRAFCITKASIPFPPHMLEEKSKEELVEIQAREKANDLARTLDAERTRQLDAQLKKQYKENIDLKEQLYSLKGILENLNFNVPILELPQPSNTKRDLFIWLSDMHIGAAVPNEAPYKNTYNEEEVNKRLNKIYTSLNSLEGYDNIVICNLGDSLDGYNRQTGRGGHDLPQNMTNKEQVKAFLNVMHTFITKINSIPHNNLYYYAVGDSNHGCDFEHTAQLALSALLTQLGIKSKVFDSFIGSFKIKDEFYVISHGKDSIDMFKNWPLTINDKTENYINKWLDDNNIFRATVVKGDLHQSATSYAARFKYKSVGSLFGSSQWIMKNFGNTKPCCDFSIVENNNMLDGIITF